MLEFDQNQSALELDSDLSELFACGKQDRSDLINGLWGDAKGRRALITKVSDSTKKRYQLYSGAGQLVWEEDSDGVKKRHVYLGGTLLAREEIGSALSSNSFLRTPAAAGSYQYRVTAVNAVGNRGAGASSAFVSYNPGNPPCTPAVPAGFAATPTLSVDGNFQLSWQASCNTLRYSIEERINGGAYALFSDVPAPNLSLSISGKPSGIYEYRIMACSPDSKKLPMLCSVVSLPISVQVAIPGGLLAPTNFALAPGSQTYTNGDYWFQWNAVSGASHYQVCEYDVAGGVANACRIFAALNSSAQKYRHTIDDQLLTFFYDVAACSATACSAASRPQKAVKIDCPPGTPPNLCVGSRPSDTTNEAGTVTYIHTDQLGSPVAETNAAGSLSNVTRFRYEPYGQSLEANIAQGPSYTGHVADSASGLIYMQQRYYDPVLGRFLSTDPDPVGELGINFNRYAYAANNPYKYVDPDGREIGRYIDRMSMKLASGEISESDYVDGITAQGQGGAIGLAAVVVAAVAIEVGGAVAVRVGATIAAKSAAKVAGVVEKSGKSIQAAVANSNKAGLAQGEALSAVQGVVKGSGRQMEVLAGANGAKVAIGTVNGVVNGPPGTAAAVLIGSNGAATVGTATVSMVGKGVDVVKTVVSFVANKPK